MCTKRYLLKKSVEVVVVYRGGIAVNVPSAHLHPHRIPQICQTWLPSGFGWVWNATDHTWNPVLNASQFVCIESKMRIEHINQHIPEHEHDALTRNGWLPHKPTCRLAPERYQRTFSGSSLTEPYLVGDTEDKPGEQLFALINQGKDGNLWC